MEESFKWLFLCNIEQHNRRMTPLLCKLKHTHTDTILSLIKLNCVQLGDARKKIKNNAPGVDNKNDLLIEAQKASREKVIIRNWKFKLRKIMKAINNRRRRAVERIIVLWLGIERAIHKFLFLMSKAVCVCEAKAELDL